MSMDEVAKRLNISKTCIFNAIKKHKETGEFVDKKKKSTGREQKLDERAQRHLKRLIKGENRLSVSKIMKDLNQSLCKPITSQTVFNYLKKLSYEYKMKLWLSAKHREQRTSGLV